MAVRSRNLREELILAGIEEINTHGVGDFSIRRTAHACGVSCAAPYKHFRDKRDFIAAIIDHVNDQWHRRQEQVLAMCGSSLREQIVAISVQHVVFLMEKPHYREILMLKDNLYHRIRGQRRSTMQQLQTAYFQQQGLDEETCRRKLMTVRSIIYGSVFLFDTGAVSFNEEAIDHIRQVINREFDLP